MTENEFKHTAADPCVYIKWFGESFVLRLLYVDDMLILGKDIPIIDTANTFFSPHGLTIVQDREENAKTRSYLFFFGEREMANLKG